MKDFGQIISGVINGLLIFFYFLLHPQEWSFTLVFMIILSILVSFPLTVLIHELGHLLFGWMQGMRLLNMSVGPFVIERYEGKTHLHVVRSVLGYMGRAMMYFPERIEKEIMRKKLVSYIYGGAVMNLLLAAISFFTAYALWHHPFFIVLGALNILIGASNLTAITTDKGVHTDGMMIRKLRTTSVDQSYLLMTYDQLIEMVNKKDAKKWDSDLIRQIEKIIIEQVDEPTVKSLLQMIGYYHFPNNADRVEEIGSKIAFKGKKKSSDLWQDFADISFATALFFNEKLLEYPDIMNSLEQISDGDRVTDLKRKALVAYIQGDRNKALLKLKEADTYLEKWSPLYLRGDNEKQLLKDMIGKIE